MTIHKSEFLNVVKERGFFHQCSDLEGLDKILHEQKPVTAYIGFDCTAPSLHVGSLMQIMILRWFQKCGHRPIVLMGGGTTKIGDPSGKDEARKVLSDEQIKENMQGIKKVFRKFIQFDDDGQIAANNAIMANNADWLMRLNLIDFMSSYGRYFSVNRMITMDSVKLRLEREHHLSLLEFLYMAMQAYDFVELKNKYDCRLQIGGSDQWGNIVSGTELYRRKLYGDTNHNILAGLEEYDDPHQINKPSNNTFLDSLDPNDIPFLGNNNKIFGLTTPLITTSSGAKMGKTANGAVWLNADRLSPFDYWQFWRNTEDADVGRFLRLFTELPIAEIEKLERLGGAEINEAKKILANETTKLCHGEEAANAAAETARKTFEEGGAGENLKTVMVDKAALEAGIAAPDLLLLAGIRESKGEARKLIEGGGVRINDEKIADPKLRIDSSYLTADGHIKLSAGKKQHVLVKVNT